MDCKRCKELEKEQAELAEKMLDVSRALTKERYKFDSTMKKIGIAGVIFSVTTFIVILIIALIAK